ncbi:acetoacetate decarboxylase family protein, partial [Francisella tularensis subsp. holarctica]|uniref:acetoacetate decarboxylase family protein n=1 Tax=Francisella tularensis TaxID=263 RepID=UPI0023819805
IKKALEKTPNFLLKTKPHVNGRDVSICQLVKYHVKDVTEKGAWTGPVNLQVFNHVQAALHHLPVLEIVKGFHFIADVKLGFGEVVFDYLK